MNAKEAVHKMRVSAEIRRRQAMKNYVPPSTSPAKPKSDSTYALEKAYPEQKEVVEIGTADKPPTIGTYDPVDPYPSVKPATSSGSRLLTSSEFEQLKQSQEQQVAYLKGRYPNVRIV